MSAKVDIVLIDGGDDISSSFDSGGTSGGMPSRSVSPSEVPRSSPGDSPSSKKQDQSAVDAATTLAGAISKALGGVALVDAAIRLKQAFEDIYKAVTGLDRAINREQDDGSGAKEGTGGKSRRKTTVEAASRTKADDEDVIDGEFTLSPNKPADGPSVLERGLTVANRAAGDDPVTAMTKRTSLPENLGAGNVFSPAKTAVEVGAVETASAAPAAAKGLASVAAAAGPLAIAIGATVAAVAAGAIVLKGAFDAINTQVQRLEGVSADVSVATSNTEIRRELADIRRADQIGPQLARFENMRSKFEDKAADLYTEILKVLLNLWSVAEPFTKDAMNGLEVVTTGVELGNKNLELVIDALRKDIPEGLRDLRDQGRIQARFGKAVVDLLARQRDDEEENLDDPFLQAFLGQFGGGPI